MTSSSQRHAATDVPRGRRSGAVRIGVLVATVLGLSGLAGCSSDSDAADATAAPTIDTTVDTTAAPVTPATEPPDDTTAETVADTTDETTDETTGDAAAIEATRALFAGVGDDDPGCTVAVGRDGQVVYAEAFGAARLNPSEPMTTDTIVDIGSTSKQFTATAILLLSERGLVDLDEPLATYLPDLPDWAAQTSLRQLMHHTSGIPDYIELLANAGFELTGSSTDADALDALGEVSELDFEPGSSWAYSNSNYFLLGQVVLAVTGQPLDEFLDAEVFQPLGLAMVMDPVAALPGKAVSYEGTGDDRQVADSRWEQLGDGGIQTTPSELVRWATQYWDPTIGGDELLADRLDGAVVMDPSDPTARYGAGIMTADDPDFGTVLSHSGGWGGFVTAFALVPDQQLAVAATCTSPDTLALIGVGGDEDLLSPWVAQD